MWTPPDDWANNEIVTHTKLNEQLRDNMKELWHEVARVEFTSNVGTTGANTEASPLDVVSSGAFTYEAAPTIVEFACPGYSQTGSGALSLWDGSTEICRLTNATISNFITPDVFISREFTPTAASHTYKVRAWGSGTGTVYAGTGVAGTHAPGFIRVLQRGG